MRLQNEIRDLIFQFIWERGGSIFDFLNSTVDPDLTLTC
eukprot:10070.XXX_596401_596517_1 [CDS] Oithona nana genome sequencing.